MLLDCTRLGVSTFIPNGDPMHIHTSVHGRYFPKEKPPPFEKSQPAALMCGAPRSFCCLHILLAPARLGTTLTAQHIVHRAPFTVHLILAYGAQHEALDLLQPKYAHAQVHGQ